MYETEPQLDGDIPIILMMVAVTVWLAFYRATNNFWLSVIMTVIIYLVTFIGYLIYK